MTLDAAWYLMGWAALWVICLVIAVVVATHRAGNQFPPRGLPHGSGAMNLKSPAALILLTGTAFNALMGIRFYFEMRRLGAYCMQFFPEPWPYCVEPPQWASFNFGFVFPWFLGDLVFLPILIVLLVRFLRRRGAPPGAERIARPLPPPPPPT